MGGEARRQVGLTRTLSVDSFKSVKKKSSEVKQEKKVLEFKTITYKTFPKSYKESKDGENIKTVSNKNELYMKTLTFQEIEDLDILLLNKMR